MTGGAVRPWLGAVAGGLALAAAMPGVLPLAVAGPLLVLPGLMAWFAIATAEHRPVLRSYVFGCVCMAVFSWSVSHVLFPAYLAVVLVGGGYFALGTLAVRPWRRRLLPFALAVAATCWLRAYMPEIYYPHGQPAHALFRFPLLLAAVTLGGEPLGNALLAALAAAAVECWRGWRGAEPPFAAARTRLLAVAATAIVATGVGRWLQTARPVNATVDIAALETGLHSLDLYAMSARDYAETLRDRLFVPTAALLRDAAPPDLVLWPETAMPHVKVSGDDLDASRARIGELAALSPAAASRILLGVLVVRNERLTPVAVLAEPGPGTVSGDYEKQRLVPGGEFLPLTRVLPAAIGDWLFDVFDAALGSAPNFLPGSPRPPLRTASGVQFGALMCYDNAFPEPAARLVGAGARFLVVLSNETWFRGGAELEQLVAMTVCRALELGVPIVRATTDGWTVVVGADGQLGDGLEPAPLPRRETRILRTKLPIGAAAEVPMAPWRAALGPLAALWLGAAILHAVVRWARLRSDRKAA